MIIGRSSGSKQIFLLNKNGLSSRIRTCLQLDRQCSTVQSLSIKKWAEVDGHMDFLPCDKINVVMVSNEAKPKNQVYLYCAS